jgi:hypothetical protein
MVVAILKAQNVKGLQNIGLFLEGVAFSFFN